ncbi:hypothetical protein E4U44_005203 [Claviceps purpurea]|nr:hypothetical protein E4U44_005203 [Claviceps purpurea]
MAVGERRTFRTEELEERPTSSSRSSSCHGPWEADLEFWWGTACGWQLHVASCNCKQLRRAGDSWQQLAKHLDYDDDDDDDDDRNLELATSPGPESPNLSTFAALLPDLSLGLDGIGEMLA